jgi:hypothetical protein
MKAPDKIERRRFQARARRQYKIAQRSAQTHGHVHIRVDKDTLRTTWINYENGKPAGEMVLEPKRKR